LERHRIGFLHRRHAGRSLRYVQAIPRPASAATHSKRVTPPLSGPKAAAMSGLFGGVFLAVIEGLNLGLQKYFSPNSQMNQVLECLLRSKALIVSRCCPGADQNGT
jgi:hypothetical protein